jgi:hypothetical protein
MVVSVEMANSESHIAGRCQPDGLKSMVRSAEVNGHDEPRSSLVPFTSNADAVER